MKNIFRTLIIALLYFAIFISFNVSSQETKFIYFNF